MLFRYVSGFLIALLKTGKPPEKTKNGEGYAPPRRRLFIGSNPLIADLYNSEIDYLLAIHTCWFAEVAGIYEKAHYWAIRSYDIGIKSANKSILTMNGLDTGIYLLRENRYKESLNMHLDSSLFYVQTIKNKTEKKLTNAIPKTFFLEEGIPSDIKKQAEEKMLVFWAIPTLMNLSIINLFKPQLASKYAGEIINECLRFAQRPVIKCFGIIYLICLMTSLLKQKTLNTL